MSEQRDLLLRNPKPAYETLPEGEWEKVLSYCESYKTFLDKGKTERECVDTLISELSALGAAPFDRERDYRPGDRFYAQKHGKALLLCTIGKKPLSEGLRMVASHIDAPRIDLKPYPLYEKEGFALFKTHYYGGIKKYQWMATPLALHGIVFLKDGSPVNISIGDDPSDPVLFISDILPHLGAEQVKKPVSEAFPGENLNVTTATLPHPEEGKDRVKLAVMAFLHHHYGMTEDDFQSAEICLCPAGKARDVGLDGSMLGGYGQDDRSCSYAAIRALLDTPVPEYTSVCILADKEEIGSEGLTGMQSAFFDMILHDLCKKQGVSLRNVYDKSFCLSGDVCNALDPNFLDVSDPMNNSRAGYGPGIYKATGHRGKAEASDASAETMSRLRRMLDTAGIPWQMGEMGKVDQGGGGTVAKYIASRGIEVVDIGIPVLSMHSPFEITCKVDCYLTYRAFMALFEDKT